MLLTVVFMDAIAKAGKIDAATRKIVARSGLGEAMRAGAKKPDISTTEAFKQAMQNAKSIAYVTVGVSGRHFIAMCERLGIADEVKAKGKTKSSGNVAEFVSAGEAELAIQQISELLSTHPRHAGFAQSPHSVLRLAPELVTQQQGANRSALDARAAQTTSANRFSGELYNAEYAVSGDVIVVQGSRLAASVSGSGISRNSL